MTREILTAPRTYYVRSDALYTDAPGRLDSQAGACKTWQQAANLAAALDLNSQPVTLQHGSESGIVTFAEAVTINTMVGAGVIIVKGQATAGHTVIDSTAQALPCFWLSNTNVHVQFANITLKGGGLGYGLIQIVDSSTADITNGVVFDTAVSAHIWVHDNPAKFYALSSSYSIIGGAGYHVFVNMGGAFMEQIAITLVGTPAFGGAFIAVVNGGALQSPSATTPLTFTGTATGQRYLATTNGAINTGGGGATYFPGSVAGATSSGGQYA